MSLAGLLTDFTALFPVASFGRLVWGLASAVVLGISVHKACGWLETKSNAFGDLSRQLSEILGPLSRRETFALAALSGIGEELLFRGLALQHIGLVASTLLFAVIHCYPPNRSMLLMISFAGAMGALLGGLALASQSIIPAILLHFLVNYLNLNRLCGPGEDKQHIK